MRQGQQNRRGRGRNNNHSGGGNNHQQHRKGGQNPLTRSFESTGPDMKIRGTPAHIAEKYMALARDAMSSGDPVLAENYLQHAEHYNRIIMAYREQQASQGGGDMANGANGARPRFGEPGSGDDFGGEDGDGDMGGGDGMPYVRGTEPQPRSFDQPRYDDRGNRGPDQNRPHRDQRNGGGFDRGDRPERQDRHERQDRQDRQDRFQRHDRGDRPERPERQNDRPPIAAGDAQGEPHQARRPDRPDRGPDRGAVPTHEQPEFLRRPVRRPRREASAEDTPSPAVEDAGGE